MRLKMRDGPRSPRRPDVDRRLSCSLLSGLSIAIGMDRESDIFACFLVCTFVNFGPPWTEVKSVR